MCIRDSGRRVREQRPVGQRAQGPDRDDRAEPRQGARRHGLQRPADGPREFDRCLLYTSDAADERSSVVLGGRRIIKKQNTNKKNKSHDARK